MFAAIALAGLALVLLAASWLLPGRRPRRGRGERRSDDEPSSAAAPVPEPAPEDVSP
jgi:hypothetical protein